MKLSHSWLQTYFSDPLPSIEEIDALLVAHSFETEGIEDINDEKVLDVDVLPNRAHDCLGYEGLARELGGLMGVEVLDTVERYTKSGKWEVGSGKASRGASIENTTQCRRYALREIQGVGVGESPEWLQGRLGAMGQRSINNLVDATNYVLFDLGQPTHIFDAKKVVGDIVVRSAHEGETMTALGDQEITLDPSMLVIADQEKVLALAGVKGGTAAEVDENTTDILLEVANFEPISTRKTRQKVGIFTDASKRYENELSPEVVAEAIEALTLLVLQVGGGDGVKVGEVVDVYPSPQAPVQVTFATDHTNRLTGFSLAPDDIADILNRFGYQFSREGEEFTVDIPARRYDLRIPEDMIEEIGRIYGYHNLEPQSVADLDWDSAISPMVYYQHRIRNVLVAEGFSELMTYSFVKKGEVEMLNVLASDKKALRTNLADGFGESLAANMHHAPLLGTDCIRAFEMGRVFVGGEEKNHLVVGVQNKDKKARKQHGFPHEQLADIATKLNTELSTDFFAAPGEGQEYMEWDLDQLVAQLPAPDAYGDVFAVDIEKDDNITFKPYSSFPFVTRDIALWAPQSVGTQDIQQTLVESAGELCQRIDLFDTYQPEGEDRISYAFSLVFQAMDRTLTDEEMLPVMEKVTEVCEGRGWEVR